MHLRHRLSALFAVLFFLVAPRAMAQTVTIGASVIQAASDGSSTPLHPHVNDRPVANLVNYQDCIDDNTIVFQISVSGATTDTSNKLQAWAGPDNCSANTSRGSGGVATCWPIVGGDLPRTNQSVAIKVRDLIGGFVADTKNITYQQYPASVCSDPVSLGKLNTPTAITINFMWVNNGTSNVAGTAASYTTFKTDLIGPGYPSGLSVGPDNQSLVVNWTAVEDADAVGYRIYCQAVTGAVSNPAADSGQITQELVCQDGGTSDGGFDDNDAALPGIPLDGGCTVTNVTTGPTTTVGSTTCQSSTLSDFAGGSPSSSSDGGSTTITSTPTPIPSEFLCGTVNDKTQATYRIGGLINGTVYNVRVASIDGFDNAGGASNTVCDSPTQTVTFWDNYRDDGGQAGGGFCAFSPSKSGVPFLGFFAVALLVVIRFRRRS